MKLLPKVYILFTVLLSVFLLSGTARADSGTVAWNISAVHGEAAWDMGCYGNDIRIAVIDSGIIEDSELSDAVLPGYNFIGNSSDVTDNMGHGTFVSGIIVAALNDVGISGLAPKAKIVPLKCFDKNANSTVDIIAEAVYAAVDDFGCDIINMSLGVSQSDDNVVLEEAIKYAVSAGCIIIASAGNGGSSEFNYPAAYDGVIGVGAVDKNLKVCTFSQKNTSVDVVAPGSNVESISVSGFSDNSGTSFSAPHVTALAAIAKSIDPTLNGESFLRILAETSLDLGDEGYDTSYGYGLIDVEKVLHALLSDQTVYISPISEINGKTQIKIYNNSSISGCYKVITTTYENGVLAGTDVTDIILEPFSSATAPVDVSQSFSFSVQNENGTSDVRVKYDSPSKDKTEILLIPHTHCWEYTFGNDNSVISTCTNDGHVGENGFMLHFQILATPYTGKAVTPYTNADEVTYWLSAGAVLPAFAYQYSSSEDGEYVSVSAPVNAGYYRAKVTVPGVTATYTVTFAVAKINREPITLVKVGCTDNTVTVRISDTTEKALFGIGTDGNLPEIWQESNCFYGLERNTFYTFFAKIPEDENHYTVISEGLSVKTADYEYSWTFYSGGNRIFAMCINPAGLGDTLIQNFTLEAPENLLYDGRPKAVTVSGHIENTPIPDVTYYAGEQMLTAPPIDAGSYTAVITVDSVSAVLPFTVEKRTLVFTSDDYKSVYDGNTVYGTVRIAGDDFAENEGVIFSVRAFRNVKDSGENTFNYHLLDNTNPENYLITMNFGQVVIVPKEVVVSGVKAKSKLYDGNLSVSVDTDKAEIHGCVPGDKLSVTATGKFWSESVGEHKAVTLENLCLSGDNADNYIISAESQFIAYADIIEFPIAVIVSAGILISTAVVTFLFIRKFKKKKS